VEVIERGGFLIPLKKLTEAELDTIESFKLLSKNGMNGPFKVEECKVKGFIIKALYALQENCLISFYVGDVDSLVYRSTSDEDDMLVLCSTDKNRDINNKRTLLICARVRANISRYISGINNDNPYSRAVLNVRTNVIKLRDGKLAVILYTSRAVAANEELYWDYNQGDEDINCDKDRSYQTSTFQ
jgi:hypothetical protein